jgi:hypothetical protein
VVHHSGTNTEAPSNAGSRPRKHPRYSVRYNVLSLTAKSENAITPTILSRFPDYASVDDFLSLRPEPIHICPAFPPAWVYAFRLVVEASELYHSACLLIAQSWIFSAFTLVISNYVVATQALRGFQQLTGFSFNSAYAN